MAQEAKKIDLFEPIVWFDKTIATLVLKPPKGLLFMRLGDPRFAVVAADKSQYWIEKDDVISAYISELLTADGETRIDGGDAIFAVLGLTDIMQVREALFDFFTVARAMISVRNSISSSLTSGASMPAPAGR